MLPGLSPGLLKLRPASEPETSCAKCSLRETCLCSGMSAEDVDGMENVVYVRRRIGRGGRLFGAGDAFHSIYAVRTGFFKTILTDSAGREQVTGFFMGGELLGLNGLGNGRYQDSAIALENSHVCAMPYSLIAEMGRAPPSLARRLHSALAREISRNHGIMLLLGSMSAEERLATFLLNLSRRLQRRGYSGVHFILRMTREEIGSYLGLKLETVSRLFSAFHKEGLLDVQHKEVSIVDVAGLERVVAGASR